ncbi:hypothetical protein LZ554_001886 [Drepanopeziza brunnea f. sp. 'monogermtubi']|nr:hypothetical protein LZ554_001886 [Drepanopeziza brunnea f. sp. 'monogermtubi']
MQTTGPSRTSRTSSIREEDGDQHGYNYAAVPHEDEGMPAGDEEPRYSIDLDSEHHVLLKQHLKQFQRNSKNRIWIVVMGALAVVLFFYLAIADHTIPHVKAQCDSIDGFTCQPEISQFWGQNSPYYAVPSEIATEVPEQCTITFAQMLSRHGARDPTEGKTTQYKELITQIHTNVTSYNGSFAFLKDYNYTLGADQLTLFGQNEMVSSGTKFYNRYKTLTKAIAPFIRASNQTRVVESATNWTQGFHTARIHDPSATTNGCFHLPIELISEDAGKNNTLDHGLCTSFEDGVFSSIGENAQKEWQAIFTPPITARLNENLPGANLTNDDTILMMDLCPFNTVADDAGNLSPFCSLFTVAEWQSYDYLQSVGKYYHYSNGNPLGPTQGVGFTNELIARLTSSPVVDHTSTNSTMTGSNATFPLGAILYADFSHDNDMMTIFSAIGLFNSTPSLLNTTFMSLNETNGYQASRIVPFSARAYFEKMMCVGESEEMVRVVVNDRVMPLETCGGDELGRCTLGAFVDSLTFAREGGLWDSCFT